MDGPQGRPIPQDGYRIGGRSGVLHHSWRRALTQCRASTTSRRNPKDRVDPSTSPFLSALGSGLCLPLGGRRSPVSILTPLRGVDASAWLTSGLRHRRASTTAALTLRIDLAARVPFRAIERLVSPTCGLLIRGSPPLQGVAMTGLAYACFPAEARYGIRYPVVRPCGPVAGGGCTLRVPCRGSAAAVSSGQPPCTATRFHAGRFGFCQTVDAGSVKGLPFTAPTLAASEFLDGARVPFGAFRAGPTLAGRIGLSGQLLRSDPGPTD